MLLPFGNRPKKCDKVVGFYNHVGCCRDQCVCLRAAGKGPALASICLAPTWIPPRRTPVAARLLIRTAPSMLSSHP